MSIRFEVEGSTAWITVDRPETRNAMTFDMYADLVRGFERVDADDQIQTTVISGAWEVVHRRHRHQRVHPLSDARGRR